MRAALPYPVAVPAPGSDTEVMSVVRRATDEPAPARPDYWRHVVSDTFAPMDMVFEDAELDDELVTHEVGAVRVSESWCGPGEVRRTARQIRRQDPDSYQVIVPVHGRTAGEQDGRRAVLGPGDFSVADLSRPLHCVHERRHAVLLTFPRALMPLRHQEVARLAVTRIPGDRGIEALVSTMVRQLPRRLAEHDGNERARLGTAVLDLLAVALSDRLDIGTRLPVETRRQALATRIDAFIETHLADPSLTPARVAAAHHVSVRYLHKLFEDRGQTVAALIRQRRLERCRRDLLDPALADRPVYATAARWGLLSSAHFNRMFRDAYGLPPGEFRHAHLPQHPPQHDSE